MSTALNDNSISFGSDTQSYASLQTYPVWSDYSVNTTYSWQFIGANTAPFYIYFNIATIQGGYAGIQLSFSCGIGGLTNTWTAVPYSVINWVVFPCPSWGQFFSWPENGGIFYWRADTTALNIVKFNVSIWQF